jgi:heme/copper-type cytochrome/quinol oxidase subunit 2
MTRTKLTIIIIVVVIAAGAVSLYLLLPLLPGREGAGVCNALPHYMAQGMAVARNGSTTARFTVIESDPNQSLAIKGYPNGPYEGMNGSAYHLKTPWPIMIVHKGQTVVIDVYNCATSESHAFAIAHYYPAGAVVHPGQSITIGPFTVNQTGNFTVYCNIFCSIHFFMQNGRLDVTA